MARLGPDSPEAGEAVAVIPGSAAGGPNGTREEEGEVVVDEWAC